MDEFFNVVYYKLSFIGHFLFLIHIDDTHVTIWKFHFLNKASLNKIDRAQKNPESNISNITEKLHLYWFLLEVGHLNSQYYCNTLLEFYLFKFNVLFLFHFETYLVEFLNKIKCQYFKVILLSWFNPA